MANAHGGIRHALQTEHAKLIAELDVGIQQLETSAKYSNAQDICRHVERFVAALYQVSGGQAELQKRTELIDSSCGPSSGYETARARAQSSYSGGPLIITGEKRAFERLRGSGKTHLPLKSPPFLLDQIEQEYLDIERILQTNNLNLSVAARDAFQAWGDACREVQEQAELLDVDGCWYLFNVHQARGPNPADRAKLVKSIVQAGRADLELMKAAADSLVSWASNNLSNASTGAPSVAPNVGKPQKQSKSGSSTNPPSDVEFACYRAYRLTKLTQTEVAKIVIEEFGGKFDQGRVSRAVTAVDNWLAKGNVFPDMPKPTRKKNAATYPTDPSVLELGAREDHQTPRQRAKLRDDSED